jgi:hypothetical protein
MATIAEIQAAGDAVSSLVSELKIAREEFLAKINAVDPASPTAKAELDALKSEYRATGNTVAARRESLVNNFTSLAGQGAGFFNKSQVQAIVDRVNADINSLNQSPIPGALETLDKQISQADKPQEPAPPAASAAAAVATSGEGATQHPPPAPTTEGRVTAAQAATLAGGTPTADSGTNAATRTLEQTQSVPAQPAQPTDTNRETPTAGGQPVVGAANDDRSGTRSTTKLIIDKFSGTVRPQPNVLDQYASYTYSISWYLLAPETYGKVLNSSAQRPNLAGDQLLMQSGGAPVSGNTPGAVGRNAYFPNDYYLDNLEIKSVMLGSGSRSAHNSTEIKFIVTEPNGITLYENLYQAVKEVYNEVNLPYSQAQFCLVIRFYGYDAQGNLVAAHAPNTSVTDRSAVVEKFYPFQIKNIKFRIANRLVEYSVDAMCIPYNVGMSTNRGTINSSMELAGLTVLDLLEGTGVSTAEPAPEDTGRTTTATPPTSPPPPPVLVRDLPMKQQAAIAAGVSENLISDDGAAPPI